MRTRVFSFLAAVILLFCACGTETPSRDHIPLLQDRLYRLQVAVAAMNASAIDSLLSLQILEVDQSSDSLLNFVYGPAGGFDFQRFGNYEIFFTDDRARIDCFVMDSTGRQDRPITLTYVFEHDMWLLKSFEKGKDIIDSVEG
ncbi:MAG: hypothetical protein JSU65_01850 [Candidatus Zixiibacteriota bacterium]|nr:MAG: hypothetical protein JSU65_01850 [candidate division Zixibacteria bacterium]